MVSRSSGLTADVSGASTSDGAQVVQWTANNGTNQQWQFVRV
ncbi:RICIN domain-containing protein [Micromonospora sp. NPDC049101]